MSAAPSSLALPRHNAAVTEAPWLRRLLIAIALVFLSSFLLLPLLL
ncbi:MAG TPA: sulfate ABC transporter permease subunit CysW, partial [Gammaproteobacteria bacterium]|nr:sulfate ABC transporter permease subunit CysW [Gammaproteobacteria bacterium]